MSTIKRNIDPPSDLLIEYEGPLSTYRYTSGTVDITLDVTARDEADTSTKGARVTNGGKEFFSVGTSVRIDGRRYEVNLFMNRDRAEILHTMLGDALAEG